MAQGTSIRNPQNESNRTRADQLRAQVRRLEEEVRQWDLARERFVDATSSSSSSSSTARVELGALSKEVVALRGLDSALLQAHKGALHAAKDVAESADQVALQADAVHAALRATNIVVDRAAQVTAGAAGRLRASTFTTIASVDNPVKLVRAVAKAR